MKRFQEVRKQCVFLHVQRQINKIKRWICNPNIKVISFDIFDTLLVRPALKPDDIFHLVSNKLGVDFAKIRIGAESYVSGSNHSIFDIWDNICSRNNISSDKKCLLVNEEINLEKKVLVPRKMISELYELALSKGKRVIAVSDMYLPGDVLNDILKMKGFTGISRVYVSCDCNCRKDSGELYRHVILSEQINEQEIIHIGDNYFSDYSMAKNYGIKSFFVPSNIDLFCNSNFLNKDSLISTDAGFNTVIGYAINRYYELNNSNRMDLQRFATIILFPLIAKITYDLLNKKEFKEYDGYFFASRDGYLPYLAYLLIKKSREDGLPHGKYIYASRMAYNCLFENTILDYSKSLSSSSRITVQDYLKLTILNHSLLDDIMRRSGNEEMNKKATYDCLDGLLFPFKEELSEYFQNKKQLVKKYFQNSIKTNKGRVLVFDCGYSGSISKGISAALGNRVYVDKFYLHGTPKNSERDKHEGTQTFEVFSPYNSNYDLFWETLFSSTEGTCLGYNENGISPILNNCCITDAQKESIDSIHRSVLDSLTDFNRLLGENSLVFRIEDVTNLYSMIERIISMNVNNANVLKNVKFDDEFLGLYGRNLADMISYFGYFKGLGYLKMREVKRLIRLLVFV